jgi:hypothetical protein
MDPLDLIRLQGADRELENLLEGVVRRQAPAPLVVPHQLRSMCSMSNHLLLLPRESAASLAPSSSSSIGSTESSLASGDAALSSSMLVSCLLPQSALKEHFWRTHNSPGYADIQHHQENATPSEAVVRILFCNAGHLMYAMTRKKPSGSVCSWCGWKLNTTLAPKVHASSENLAGGVVGWCSVCDTYICVACKVELLDVAVPAVWGEGVNFDSL